METFVNTWGGEAFLSSATIAAAGCMGMFHGLMNQNEKIHVRVLDFIKDSPDDLRRKKISKAYELYYSTVFGTEPELIFDPLSMDDIINHDGTSSILEKAQNEEILALGCSVSDMQLDIHSGIYGKPWLGEVYYADTNFSRLYENIPHGTEVLIVNCGGYRGGGTATTFIPLENMYYPQGLHPKRYMVVTGPMTKFCHTVRIPYPEIYPVKIKGIPETDIFEIPELLTNLSSMFVNTNDATKHLENIHTLKKEYEKVVSEKYDFSSLNPKYYAPRFLDRIYSDCSRIDGIFINLKTDGKDFLPYDVTSRTFEPDIQEHSLHVINLVNALCIRELIKNHKAYSGGKVYAFGTDSGEKYTPSTLFDAAGRMRFWQFLVMSVLILYDIYDSLANASKPENAALIQKFDKNAGKIAFRPFRNPKILETAIKENLEKIRQFIASYLFPVLDVLHDIDSCSGQTDLFPQKSRPVAERLFRKAKNPSSVQQTLSPAEYTAATLSALMQAMQGNSPETTVKSFMQEYLQEFPLISETSDYCKEIIRYTMIKAEAFIRRF